MELLKLYLLKNKGEELYHCAHYLNHAFYFKFKILMPRKSLSVGGAATGASALVLHVKNYELLRMAIETDIEKIETSISHLQESLTSLSEVVL